MGRCDALKMSIFSALLLVVTLFILTYAEKDMLAVRASTQQGVNLEIGAMLYTLHCKSCHGIRGEGVGQLGPALADKHFFRNRLTEVSYPSTLEKYILTTTEHGRMMGTRPYYAGDGSVMVMPPWHRKYGGPLRTDQLQALTSFILNWEATASGEVVLETLELPKADPGDPELLARGRKVFARDCSACHLAEGVNSSTAKAPDLSNLSSVAGTRKEGLDGEAYIRESVMVPTRYIVDGYGESSQDEPCGVILAETELQAVTAFLLQ